MNDFHIPVLLQESAEYLRVKEGKHYIDATLGGGGHTKELLRRGGRVLGIDVDSNAINFVKERLKNDAVTLVLGNFRDIKEIAQKNGFENVDGILFDLGVSSHQLDTPDLGFSFKDDGPLDMRMDKNLAVTAKDLVNALGRKELYELFTTYGEEPFAHHIGNRIVEERAQQSITTTRELAQLVERVVRKRGNTHPATRIFQALRIAVNDELNSLKIALSDGFQLINQTGRIVVISFHSLEDRIVKDFFNLLEKEGKGKILTEHIVVPKEEEIRENTRSRSAKLRAIEKL